MALKRNPASTQVAPFEAEDDAATAPVQAADAHAGATSHAEAPNDDNTENGDNKMFDTDTKEHPATTTEVATATKTAVARTQDTSAFAKEVEAMHGALDMSYGNYRIFKASNGSISEVGEGSEDLGRWVKVRMLAWSKHWEISPGGDSKTSKDYLAFSDDGKTIARVVGDEHKRHEGKPIEDYLKYLRDDEGFDSAAVREFVDVACAPLGCERGVEMEGEVIQVSLPPSSTTAFTKYQESLKANARAVAMGLPGFKVPQDPFTFYFITEAASKGSNKWTKLKIEQKLPAKF